MESRRELQASLKESSNQLAYSQLVMDLAL
jgi:hypothetical protein